MAERRQDLHQTRVGDNLTPTTPGLQSAIQQTTAYLHVHGYSLTDAARGATAYYYEQLGKQTHLLAFMDAFRVIGIITLAVAPMVWLTKNVNMRGKIHTGH